MGTSYESYDVAFQPWMEDYQRRLLASTEELVGEPYEQYAGEELAGFTPDQLKAFELTRDGLGAYEPYLTESAEWARGGAGVFADATPEVQDLYRSGIAAFDPSTQVTEYMNPYQQEVTAKALEELNRQYGIKGREAAAQTAKAGAFGGARHGVMEAELGRGQAQAQAGMIAEDYARNYNQALAASTAAHEALQARRMKAGAGIAGLAETQAGLMGKTSTQLANLANLGQQYLKGDISALSQSGSIQQAHTQKGLDIDKAKFVEAQMQPYQRLGYMRDTLFKVPTAQSRFLTKTEPDKSVGAQIIGTGLSVGKAGEKYGWWD